MDAVAPINRIRVYYKVKDPAVPHPDKYVAVLGRGTGASVWNIPVEEDSHTPDIKGCGDPITLYVEGCDYCSDVFLKLTVKEDGDVVDTDRVRIMCAPYIMMPNVRNTYRVFVSDLWGGQLKSRLQDQFATLTKIYSENDRWVQDEFEFGIASWPPKAGGYQVMDNGVDLPRGGAVQHFGETILTGPVPDANHLHGGWFEIPAGGMSGSGDFGGNVEVSPPLPGTPYEFGKIVVGWPPMDDERIRKFFKRQRLQARAAGGSWELVQLDANWLRVGHIDEYMMFVRGPSGSKGFRIVLADPTRAQTILGTSPGDLGDVRNYATFFYGRPDAFEEAGQTTAASGANTLVDNTKDFKDLIKPRSQGGKAYKWVRIYDSTDPDAIGQIARIDIDATNAAGNPADTLVIDYCWVVRDSEDVREGIDGIYDPRRGANWDVNPPEDSWYVLVEESQWWRSTGGFEFPAIITSKEVRDDADLWAKNITHTESVQKKLNDAENVLRSPAAGNGIQVVATDFIRVPALYMADEAMGQIADRSAEAYLPGMVNLCPVNHRLIVARPFGPRWPWPNPGSPVRDIFLYDARVTQQLHHPADGRTAEDADFVDVWDNYHREGGETHCGTNYRRIPINAEREWWKHWKDPS